jgi:hypothetical protein
MKISEYLPYILLLLFAVFLRHTYPIEAFTLTPYERTRMHMEEAEREIAILVEKSMPPDPCRKYTTCKTCAAGTGCGWCRSPGICTAMDRWGFPMHGDCHPSKVAFFPNQC